MTSISVPSSRPLEGPKTDALIRVVAAAAEIGTQPLIVGAFARDVWFWHLHGIETVRATADIDISVQLPDWDSFDRFGRVLLERGLTQPIARHPEKFVVPTTGQKVDLLPFGDLSEDGQKIVWPTDQSSLSILGFDESFNSAPYVTTPGVADGTLRIATLPAIMLLKCVAMYERLDDRKKKDGADIGFTLSRYVEAGNGARLAEGPDADIMEQVRGDLEAAGSMLLGRDMGRIAERATHARVAASLRAEVTSSSQCPLAQEIARNVADGRFGRARELLRALIVGLETTGGHHA